MVFFFRYEWMFSFNFYIDVRVKWIVLICFLWKICLFSYCWLLVNLCSLLVWVCVWFGIMMSMVCLYWCVWIMVIVCFLIRLWCRLSRFSVWLWLVLFLMIFVVFWIVCCWLMVFVCVIRLLMFSVNVLKWLIVRLLILRSGV